MDIEIMSEPGQRTPDESSISITATVTSFHAALAWVMKQLDTFPFDPQAMAANISSVTTYEPDGEEADHFLSVTIEGRLLLDEDDEDEVDGDEE